MTNTNHSAALDPDGFVRARVAAEAVNVARLREELEQWLRLHFELDSSRRNDVVLAVNEALSNVAEFAYRNTERAGTVDIHALYDRATSIITVTVIDYGSWRTTAEREPKRTRGRGIPLMEALSDEVAINPTDHGTTVQMRFGKIAVSPSRRGDEVPTA